MAWRFRIGPLSGVGWSTSGYRGLSWLLRWSRIETSNWIEMAPPHKRRVIRVTYFCYSVCLLRDDRPRSWSTAKSLSRGISASRPAELAWDHESKYAIQYFGLRSQFKGTDSNSKINIRERKHFGSAFLKKKRLEWLRDYRMVRVPLVSRARMTSGAIGNGGFSSVLSTENFFRHFPEIFEKRLADGRATRTVFLPFDWVSQKKLRWANEGGEGFGSFRRSFPTVIQNCLEKVLTEQRPKFLLKLFP